MHTTHDQKYALPLCMQANIYCYLETLKVSILLFAKDQLRFVTAHYVDDQFNRTCAPFQRAF